MTTIRNQSSISNITLAKVLAMAYIVASRALMPLGLVSGRNLFIMLTITVLVILYVEHMKLALDSFLRIEIVFIVVTALSGLAFARDKHLVIDSLQVLIYAFMFGYAMFVIYKYEGNIDWIAYAWVFSALILVAYLLATGGYSSKRIAQLSINQATNVNTLGVFFMFSIWFVLYLLNKKGPNVFRIIIAIICIATFLYYIYATASRKSLIGSLFSIDFWFFFSMRRYLRRMKRG